MTRATSDKGEEAGFHRSEQQDGRETAGGVSASAAAQTLRCEQAGTAGSTPVRQEESVRTLPIGTALHEYRIRSVLGIGGFGVTYLAEDVNLACKVAIKEFFPVTFARRLGDKLVRPQSMAWSLPFTEGLQQFVAEARTLAAFRHPNIVRMRRFFEANGTAYMVMEYEEGESLFRWVTRRGCPDRRTVLQVVLLLLDGLDAVHRAGFLHRDMKPSNVIIRPDGSPVLLDFGAARRLMTQAGQPITAILTPGYAPYEQYRLDGRLGPWSDLYSLGAVMYYMVTGWKPLDAPSRIEEDRLRPAREIADLREYGGGLLTTIDWALDPDDRRRPQSVAEFRGAVLDDDPSLNVNRAAFVRAPFDPRLLDALEAHLAQHVGAGARGLVDRAARSAAHLDELCRTLEREVPEGPSQRGFRVATLRLRVQASVDASADLPRVWPPIYQVDRSTGNTSRQKPQPPPTD